MSWIRTALLFSLSAALFSQQVPPPAPCVTSPSAPPPPVIVQPQMESPSCIYSTCSLVGQQWQISLYLDFQCLKTALGMVVPPIPGVLGRYVRITQNPPEPDGTKFLSLAEVQVYSPGGTVDLALNQSATQSSTYNTFTQNGVTYRPVAGLAVDGKTDGNFFDSSVSHTAGSETGWWQVDLGSAQAIGAIVIWGRTDCCVSRLTFYTVSVSLNPDGSAPVWSNIQTVAPNPSTTIHVP